VISGSGESKKLQNQALTVEAQGAFAFIFALVTPPMMIHQNIGY
jgi:hypothetical protein